MIESLESRTLLSKAATVIILPGLANPSETNPTTSGHGTFAVTRTGSTASSLVVTYSVHSSSIAKSGLDFVALKGTVTIPAGKSTIGIRIVPIDDAQHEGSENLTLYLNSAAIPFGKRRSATVTIHDNDAGSSNWWDNNWHYRAPISVDPGTFARSNQTVEQSINFTAILQGLHRNGSLILNSIRVVETAADHSVIDADVPFQFDQDSDFNARTKASGNLVFLLPDDTTASTSRFFDVYFDTAGSFSAPTVTPLIDVDDSFSDTIGDDSFKITTTNPTNGKETAYVMEKDNGGFSSIIDDDGNDWVSYNSTAGQQGTYRGLPNLGVTGGAHPGFNSGTATLVSSGPLKTIIDVVSTGEHVKLRWEFYSTFTRCTVTKVDNGNYWFLYEGTPGGALDNNDTAVRSDQTTTTLDTNWNDANSIDDGNNVDGEWVYFNDAATNRYLFLVHNTPDTFEDSYFHLANDMTVFGFGRTLDLNTGGAPQMSATPNVFTIGLNEGGDDFNDSKDIINGTYRAITPALATAEIQ